MGKAVVPFNERIAEYWGIKYVTLAEPANVPKQGIEGICSWFPDLLRANFGRTNVTVGLAHALPGDGSRKTIKEVHPQDEAWVPFGELIMGICGFDMTEDDTNIEWVILSPGTYVIPADLVHTPPISAGNQPVPMLVFQGTQNTTKSTNLTIPVPSEFLGG